jgi:hypothetical protein
MTTKPQRDLNNILGDMTMPVFHWLTLRAVQRLRRIPPCGS